jgi:hypothetical protein
MVINDPNQNLGLTDFDIACGLSTRLLTTHPRKSSEWCGKPNLLGHEELCQYRAKYTVARLDLVARTITAVLRTVDMTAEHEPSTFVCRRRNDIRLRGSAVLGRNSKPVPAGD